MKISDFNQGDTVQWTKYACEGYGVDKHRGKILAYVPAGEDIRDVCINSGITIKRDRFGSNVSKNDRAIISVMGGAKGTLEYHYAPKISSLERI